MSRTHKNLPYDVAYRLVTGRDQETTETQEMSIGDILDKAREGVNFANHKLPYKSTVRIGKRVNNTPPGQTHTRNVIPTNSITHVKDITVYRSRHFDQNKKIIPEHMRDERVNLNSGFVDRRHTDELLEMFTALTMNFVADDLNISNIIDHVYTPFVIDGETFFYDVYRILQRVSPTDVMSPRYFDPYEFPSGDVFIIRVYRADEIIPVTVHYLDMSHTSRHEDRRIGRMSFAHPSRHYAFEHPRRRTRERDVLQDMVKDYNANGDVEELDDSAVDVPDRTLDNYWNTPEWNY